MNTIVKTIKHGAIGGIAGFIIERGLESLAGVDFIDGVLEVAGVTLGIANANRDLVEQAYEITKKRLHKEPKDVSPAEWEELKQHYPKVVDYLEKALQV